VKRIPVLFENDDCMVLNKPAGLPVQGGAGVGLSLDSILAAEFFPRPLLVHRLDRDTSGIILVAKHRAAAARFAAVFARKSRQAGRLLRAAEGAPDRVLKQYLAVCAGSPAKAGVITLGLEIRGREKSAETAYTRLRGNGDYSLLELELGTGRMHQIRRHLARTGHPVLGDEKFGDFGLNKKLRGAGLVKRLLLHASRLVIPETLAGFPLDVSSPLPDYFTPILDLFETS
jgi:23S rRNA pseudouridine955/2504/2580 synthase